MLEYCTCNICTISAYKKNKVCSEGDDVLCVGIAERGIVDEVKVKLVVWYEANYGRKTKFPLFLVRLQNII